MRKAGKPDDKTRTVHCNLLHVCNNLPLEEGDIPEDPDKISKLATPGKKCTLTERKTVVKKKKDEQLLCEYKSEEVPEFDQVEETSFTPIELKALADMNTKSRKVKAGTARELTAARELEVVNQESDLEDAKTES